LLQPLLRSCKERTHVCSVVVPSLRNAAARAQHRPPASPREMARTYLSIAYPEFITLINFAIAHNCAPALTGIISCLRTRLRTPISSVAKYSLRVSIAPKKIFKAQWSSVGTVICLHLQRQVQEARLGNGFDGTGPGPLAQVRCFFWLPK